MSDNASRTAPLTRLARAAQRTELRMRLRAGIDALVTMSALSLLALAVALTLAKVVPGPSTPRAGVFPNSWELWRSTFITGSPIG